MATLPPIKRISKEDLLGAPTWIDKLLYPINLFLDSVYNALNRSLTFRDNIISQEISFSLTAGATPQNNTAKFSVSMNVAPTGLLIKSAMLKATNYTPIASAVFIDWYYEDGFINIMSITGLTNGSIYNFKILLI